MNVPYQVSRQSPLTWMIKTCVPTTLEKAILTVRYTEKTQFMLEPLKQGGSKHLNIDCGNSLESTQ